MAVDEKLRAEGKCGFIRVQGPRKGIPCEQTAGHDTDHVNEGCCSSHGGNGGRPASHGIYAHITRPRIRELLDAAAALDDPLDLLPHVLMLQYLALDFIERYDEMSDGITAWHASYSREYRAELSDWYERNGFRLRAIERDADLIGGEDLRAFCRRVFIDDPLPDPVGSGKPHAVLDISSAAALIDRIGAMIERIHKHEERKSVSYETFEMALKLYAERVAGEVREVVDDPDQRAELGRALNRQCAGFLEDLLRDRKRSRSVRS